MLDHVWISTTPRTGSMWVLNVVREIIRSNGMTVLPDEVLQHDAETEQLFQDVRGCVPGGAVYTYKTHQIVLQEIRNAKVITMHRDPREAVVSLMRFAKFDFEPALAVIEQQIKFSNQYAKFDSGYLLTIPYSDMANDPVETVRNVSGFLGFEATDASNIVAKYRKSCVKEIVKAKEVALNELIERSERIDPADLAGDDGNYRAYSRRTGFQTGHVSDMGRDEYREALTVEQMTAINAAMGEWMDAHGYPAEY